MSPLMTEVLASQDAISKKYDELAARRIARKTNAAIVAIEQMQMDEAIASYSLSMIEHNLRHAARVQERADRLRDEFELVKN